MTADVSLDDAADGDVLACAIEGPAHVGFAEPTTVTALWPLDSQARWRIDGAIAAQIRLGAVPAQTIGPADARVLALDLVMPPNGYQPDILRSLAVTNLGSRPRPTCPPWSSGRMAATECSPPERGTTSCSAPSPRWARGGRAPSLGAVVAPGLRLFSRSRWARASRVVHRSPRDPGGGIQMESGNDGPVDQALAAPDGLLISGSPLLVTLEDPARQRAGSTVEVRMVVRNTSSERVTGIQTDRARPLWDRRPVVDRRSDSRRGRPGSRREGHDVVAVHRGAVGELRVSGGRGDRHPEWPGRRAPAISSPLHRVFGVASRLDLSLVHTMPVSVNPARSMSSPSASRSPTPAARRSRT